MLKMIVIIGVLVCRWSRVAFAFAMIYEVAMYDSIGVYCSGRYERMNELMKNQKGCLVVAGVVVLLLTATLRLDFAATRKPLASRGACGVQVVTALPGSVAVTTQ
jgi:hypothetical protein